MARRRQGHLLIELMVALSLGLLILLQMSSFLVACVRSLHVLAAHELRALQQGAVLDLLMRDLDSAVACTRDEHNKTELISLSCWRMRDGSPLFEQVVITWSRVQGRLQRKTNDVGVSQVFGNVLPGLTFDVDERVMRFVDEHNKVAEVGW